MTAFQRSLFEPPVVSPVEAATSWTNALVFGQLVPILCVLAVALVGLTMMTGHLAIRTGARVVLGCFILFGAPAIAVGFISAAASGMTHNIGQPMALKTEPIRDLPPSQYDPYAGASLRDDR